MEIELSNTKHYFNCFCEIIDKGYSTNDKLNNKYSNYCNNIINKLLIFNELLEKLIKQIINKETIKIDCCWMCFEQKLKNDDIDNKIIKCNGRHHSGYVHIGAHIYELLINKDVRYCSHGTYLEYYIDANLGLFNDRKCKCFNYIIVKLISQIVLHPYLFINLIFRMQNDNYIKYDYLFWKYVFENVIIEDLLINNSLYELVIKYDGFNLCNFTKTYIGSNINAKYLYLCATFMKQYNDIFNNDTIKFDLNIYNLCLIKNAHEINEEIITNISDKINKINRYTLEKYMKQLINDFNIDNIIQTLYTYSKYNVPDLNLLKTLYTLRFINEEKNILYNFPIEILGIIVVNYLSL